MLKISRTKGQSKIELKEKDHPYTPSLPEALGRIKRMGKMAKLSCWGIDEKTIRAAAEIFESPYELGPFKSISASQMAEASELAYQAIEQAEAALELKNKLQGLPNYSEHVVWTTTYRDHNSREIVISNPPMKARYGDLYTDYHFSISNASEFDYFEARTAHLLEEAKANPIAFFLQG